MVQAVDGKTLAAMLIHASASLDAEKQKINELNVFPVPDGDTGTNMSLTMMSAVKELSAVDSAEVSVVAGRKPPPPWGRPRPCAPQPCSGAPGGIPG